MAGASTLTPRRKTVKLPGLEHAVNSTQQLAGSASLPSECLISYHIASEVALLAADFPSFNLVDS